MEDRENVQKELEEVIVLCTERLKQLDETSDQYHNAAVELRNLVEMWNKLETSKTATAIEKQKLELEAAKPEKKQSIFQNTAFWNAIAALGAAGITAVGTVMAVSAVSKHEETDIYGRETGRIVSDIVKDGNKKNYYR